MFATETISPVSTFSVYTSRNSDSLDATQINSDKNSPVAPLVAKLIVREASRRESQLPRRRSGDYYQQSIGGKTAGSYGLLVEK